MMPEKPRQSNFCFNIDDKEVIRINQDQTMVISIPLYEAAKGFWEIVSDLAAQQGIAVFQEGGEPIPRGDHHLLERSFSDGCSFTMGPEDHDQPPDVGWYVDAPGGLEIVCPHGVRTEVIKPR
jgi:hypothetical protein